MIIKVGEHGTIRLSLGPAATPAALLETIVSIKNELANGLPTMSDNEFRQLLIDSNDYFKS